MTKAEEIQHVIGHLEELEEWVIGPKPGQPMVPYAGTGIFAQTRRELARWLILLWKDQPKKGEA